MTLRDVEVASKGYYEPINFDYLSRLESGQLMPSIPKLMTLTSIFERPINELIDLYEIETLRRFVPKGKSVELLRELGVQALDKGEVPKALALFLGMLDAARQSGRDPQKLAVALNNVGAVLIRAGRYLNAQLYLEEGFRYVRAPQTRARLLDNLAQVHYQLDRLVLAEALSREASEIAREDDVMRPVTRATRASILVDLGEYEEAERLLRDAIVEYRKSGKETSEIRQTYNLGYCLVELGKTEEGLATLRTAAARAAEKGDPDLRARSLYYYGRCLFKAGRKDDAGTPLRSALRLATENSLRNEVFHSAYYLWLLAREIGAEDDASEYFEIARDYRARLQQRSKEVEEFDRLLAVSTDRPSRTLRS